MRRRNFIAQIGAASVAVAGIPFNVNATVSSPASNSAFNPRNFKAAADGTRLGTQTVQAAIDACAKAGGGTGLLSPG